MKRKFTKTAAALALLAALFIPLGMWGQTRNTVSWDASQQSYTNGQNVTSATFDSNISAAFQGGKYYNTGTAVRVYGGNTFTISASNNNTISEIAITFGTGDGSNTITANAGTYSNGTWTGNASSVVFSVGGSSGHRRLKAFAVTYSGGGSTTYNVNLTQTTGGTISANPATAAAGTTVTLTATPDNGYSFDSWNISPSTVTITNNQFTMPASDVTVSAQWTQSGGGQTGPTVTYDFTSVQNFWIDDTYQTHPSTGSSNNLTTFYYDNETHDAFTAGGANRYFNSGYFLLGKTDATLQLPAFNFDVEKIEIVGNSGASSNVVQNIYVGNNAVSTATTGATGTNVYMIAPESQAAGTIYTLKVTSNHNTQITAINIYEKQAGTVSAPTLTASCDFTESMQVSITNNETNASVYYTTDGSTPTAATGTLYTAPFTITNTTTVKAIAVLQGNASAVTQATYTRVYTVTVNQVTGGTITASPLQAAAGATVNLTATANVGYSFGQWSIIPATTTVSNNEFVMPAEDVTVSATFTQATTYTVSFSVNGKVEMTATVNSGTAIDMTKFVADVTTQGYMFNGWYTAATGGDKLPNSYTPTADVTVYAQAGEIVSSGYTLITNVADLHAGDQVVIAANGDKNVAMSTDQRENNRGVATITKNNDNTITFDPDLVGAVVCEMTLGTANNHWTFYDPVNDGYLYAASSSSNHLKTQAENDANGEWTIAIANNGEATITAQGTYTHNVLKYNAGDVLFSCYASGQQTVWLYTKPAAKSAKGTRDAVPTTSKVTAIAADVLVTVKANGVVYLTGSNAGNEANLVVEDGGQLVASANVKGTMLKSVTGYGNATAPGNYYFISTPLTTNTNPLNVLHMINTAGYDLYYFSQNPTDELEWRNYKAGNGFNLYVGSGYLYANSESLDLEFAGTLRKSENETYNKSITYEGTQNWAGWNLVGNPFTSNAEVNMAFYKMNSTSDGIHATAMSANSVIAPMEGVFVQATEGESNQQVTFTATTAAVTALPLRSINIEVARANEMLDRAIVNVNGEGSLGKLNLSDNTTKLYFSDNTKDYAIVSSAAQSELPVNFKASRNGSYTLSVNPENVEMNYLHLIDNMTGADVDLLATPSYTFEARTNDYASRFRLLFSANGVEENGASTGSATFAYFNGSSWTVSNIGEATLQVVDVMGRVLSSETISGNTEININQPAGVYMLRLVNGNDVKVQKVVVR